MTTPPPTPLRVEVAVGGVVLGPRGILLIRRGTPPGAGQWSVPGGRVEVGEQLHEAVSREVLEETGVAIEVLRFLGWVERIETGRHHFVILDFLARPTPTAIEPRSGTDAVDTRWVDAPELGALDLVPGLLEFLVEHEVVSPPPHSFIMDHW